MSTVTKTLQVSVPAGEVWAAITDKAKMKEWYFNIPDFDVKPGTVFNFYEKETDPQYHHRGEILEVIPNQKLVHTWTHPGHSKGSSTLTWQLTSNDNGTLIELTHEGLENFADAGESFSAANFDFGWEGIIKSNLKNYLYGAIRLKFFKTINAQAATVWHHLWNDESYKEWSSAFSPGSYKIGQPEMNARWHFLTPSGQGMYSDLVYVQESVMAIFKHLGNILNFEEQPISDDADSWNGMLEQYTLHEKDGQTTLQVIVDTYPKWKGHMEERFPVALDKLAALCEA